MNGAPAAETTPPETVSGTEARFRRTGVLFVVSAPSGAGKSTLLNALRPTSDVLYSVSCTTRTPRPGEIPGEDYHFLSKEEFERRIEAREFLEFARVHDNYYGTLLAPVAGSLAAGRDVLIDVDTQGATQIRANESIRGAIADVFIMPPSLAELRRRLLKRGTETPAQLEVRLRNASVEMQLWKEYRYCIVTGSVEEDVERFRAIMEAERHLTRRLTVS
jgi:guanylate kinase